jgi:hypothetical protein
VVSKLRTSTRVPVSNDRWMRAKNVKHRGHKFLNNELRTVVGIDEGKIKVDKGEIFRMAPLSLSTGE